MPATRARKGAQGDRRRLETAERPRARLASKPLLSVDEVAILLGLNRSSVYRSVQRGDFPLRVFPINGRLWVPRRAVEGLLQGANAEDGHQDGQRGMVTAQAGDQGLPVDSGPPGGPPGMKGEKEGPAHGPPTSMRGSVAAQQAGWAPAHEAGWEPSPQPPSAALREEGTESPDQGRQADLFPAEPTRCPAVAPFWCWRPTAGRRARLPVRPWRSTGRCSGGPSAPWTTPSELASGPQG